MTVGNECSWGARAEGHARAVPTEQIKCGATEWSAFAKPLPVLIGILRPRPRTWVGNRIASPAPEAPESGLTQRVRVLIGLKGIAKMLSTDIRPLSWFLFPCARSPAPVKPSGRHRPRVLFSDAKGNDLRLYSETHPPDRTVCQTICQPLQVIPQNPALVVKITPERSAVGFAARLSHCCHCPHLALPE